MSDVVYLTKEWLEKLQAELKHLKEVTRVEIAEKLKEAISFWDLSENAEYEEARSEQAKVEVRITEIEEQLKHVELIEEAKKWTTGKIMMGMTVSIENIDTKEKGDYKIVWTTETNILDKLPRISNESPIGQAILGKKKGDTVKVKAQWGVSQYKIVKIA